MVKITGQNPAHPHVFSTLYRGNRYDVNIKTGNVWGYTYTDAGTRTRKIRNGNLICKILDAVNNQK